MPLWNPVSEYKPCVVYIAAKSAISVFSAKSDSGLGTSSRPSGPEDEERSRPRSAAAGVTSSADAAPPSASPIRRIWFSESQLGVATKETNDDPQAIQRLLILILLCVLIRFLLIVLNLIKLNMCIIGALVFMFSCLNISPQWRNMALQSQERRSSKLTNHLLASIGAIKKSTRHADNIKLYPINEDHLYSKSGSFKYQLRPKLSSS
jgi:hypothetical protein